MNKYTCRICDNETKNIPYTGIEMMLDTKDEFTYFKCDVCGCLQIANIPDNIEKYYPSAYYSMNIQTTFKNKIALLLSKLNRVTILKKVNFVGHLAYLYNKYYKNAFPWFRRDICNFNSKILDIGCGTGYLLNDMNLLGFKNLTGIDPYISEDIIYPNGVKIFKQDIYKIDKTFDFVMLNHSFEHMTEPSKVCSKLASIINPDGIIMIRIPIIDCYAWRKYKMNWFQVDAPRHFFLHSVKSIELLAKAAGLRVDQVTFDSNENQLYFSEKYSKGNAGLSKDDETLNASIKDFKAQAKKLNQTHDGDQACFYLKKI